MLNRRKFINDTVLSAGALGLMPGPFSLLKKAAVEYKLTILHTNDVHSHLDPFPVDGSTYAGLGGAAARAALIKKIRKEEPHVLLLDAGDMFQGTPYFNRYKGELELKLMTQMGYDAAIMGNHEFDAGLENFVNQITKHASFPILMCNYDFSGTLMESKYQSYKIFRKGDLRIGVTGVGIEMKGLVLDHLTGGIKYMDPVQRANETAYYLKRKKNCDMVICLSHLGDRYGSAKVSDEVLAKESEEIDLIIGGHTHQFFREPRVYRNRAGREVIVNQVGWAGLQLGRLDFSFAKGKVKNLERNQAMEIGSLAAQ